MAGLTISAARAWSYPEEASIEFNLVGSEGLYLVEAPFVGAGVVPSCDGAAMADLIADS